MAKARGGRESVEESVEGGRRACSAHRSVSHALGTRASCSLCWQSVLTQFLVSELIHQDRAVLVSCSHNKLVMW